MTQFSATFCAAAASAAYASADAAYSGTRKKVLAECAEIVRKHYPELPT